MKTHLGIAVVFTFLLAGCAVVEPKETVSDRVVELTEQAFLLNNEVKDFMPNLSREAVEDLVYQMENENSNLIGIDTAYDSITEGLTDDAAGKKVICYKLPVTFSFTGNERTIEDFLKWLNSVNSKVVMNKFELSELETDYDVKCLVCFIGESAISGIGSNSNAVSLIKKDKTVKEEEEIVLRDFDVNLTVRPSNSDAASVTVATENGNALRSDENSTIKAVAKFYKEGSQCYCQYSLGNETQTDKISVGNEVKFDVLSCKHKLDTDLISVDLNVQNNLSIPVDVVVYNDSDNRVKITKTGSVEVNRK